MRVRLLGGDSRGQEIDLDTLPPTMIINGQHYDLTDRYEGDLKIYLFNELRSGSKITSSTVTDHNASQDKRFISVRQLQPRSHR